MRPGPVAVKHEAQVGQVNPVALPGVGLPRQIQMPPPPPHIVPQIPPGGPGVAQQVINLGNPSQIIPGQMGLPDMQVPTTQQFNVQGESNPKIGDQMFGVMSGTGQPQMLQPANIGAGGGIRPENFGGDIMVANVNPFSAHLSQGGVVQNQGIAGGVGGLQASNAVLNIPGGQDNDFGGAMGTAPTSQPGVHPMMGMDMNVDQSAAETASQAALDGGRKGTL